MSYDVYTNGPVHGYIMYALRFGQIVFKSTDPSNSKKVNRDFRTERICIDTGKRTYAKGTKFSDGTWATTKPRGYSAAVIAKVKLASFTKGGMELESTAVVATYYKTVENLFSLAEKMTDSGSPYKRRRIVGEQLMQEVSEMV